jgi:hypothetical protein
MGAEKQNTDIERQPHGKSDHQKTVSGKKQHAPEDKVGGCRSG